MKNKLILIIEDDGKHLQDAKSNLIGITHDACIAGPEKIILGAIKQNTEIGLPAYVFARTYREAAPWFKHSDGIISDIYFPLDSKAPFNNIEPIGVRVASELEKLGKPFVLNTSGYHHGPKFQWIYEMVGNNKWDFIESGNSSGEGNTKNWKAAYETLIKKIKND